MYCDEFLMGTEGSWKLSNMNCFSGVGYVWIMGHGVMLLVFVWYQSNPKNALWLLYQDNCKRNGDVHIRNGIWWHICLVSCFEVERTRLLATKKELSKVCHKNNGELATKTLQEWCRIKISDCYVFVKSVFTAFSEVYRRFR